MNGISVVKAVKTPGEDTWQLDVLGIPFGSVDSDGEFFTASTKLYEEWFNNPLVLYYHSWDENNQPQGEPEVIGKVTNRDKKEDGWWFRVVLDRTKALAHRIWEAAKEGKAAASSGSLQHLARILKEGKSLPYVKGIGGEIAVWPLAELSLMDVTVNRQPANPYAVALPVVKARYAAGGINLPDDIDLESSGDEPKGKDKGQAGLPSQRSEPGKDVDKASPNLVNSETTEGGEMDPQEVKDLVAKSVADALKADAEEREAREALEEQIKARETQAAEAAVKAVTDEYEQKLKRLAEDNRLPTPSGVPATRQFASTAAYDDLEISDLAVLYGIQSAAKAAQRSSGPTEDLLKTLAIRLADSEEGQDPALRAARNAFKMTGAPVKANELNQSTLANYGDEWVGVTYSTSLWDKIRLETEIVGNVPTVIVPPGSESLVIPVGAASPTFYKVAQASAQASNLGHPTATITSSKRGTANQTLTVSKLGAAVPWTGELDEDSLIPWAAEIRRDLTLEAAEVIEHIVIDGDTDTSATTNINDIGGTPGGNEAFLLFNGFRKLALVTNTANSRDGGALAIADFLETVKLMGLGGRNAFDRTKVGMISDMFTYWKALDLTEMKSRDYVPNSTVVGQSVMTPWGYKYFGSPNMHRANQDASYGLRANSAGKIDLDTASNNTLGALLAVRWDQWRFGYKRRMTFELDRDAYSDSTTIVVTMRVGLINRDTEASAISYNLTV